MALLNYKLKPIMGRNFNSPDSYTFIKNLSVFRIALVFFAAILILTGLPNFFIINEYFDPFFLRIILASFFLGLNICTYTHKYFIHNFRLFFNPLLFLVLSWAVYIAHMNNYSLHTVLIYLFTVSSIPWAFENHKNIAIYAIVISIVSTIFFYYSPYSFIDSTTFISAIIIFQFLAYIIIKSKHQSYYSLYESEGKFTAIVQALGEGVSIFNSKYEFTYANAFAEIIFDVDKNQLIGCTLFDFISKEDIKKLRNPLDKLSNTSITSEIKITSKKNKIKHLIITESLFTINKESNAEIISVFRDITERKNTELELKQTKEKAEESDKLKTAFLQNMSHEIRSPLNAIMGFSSILTENYTDKSKIERFAGIINQRCRDLLEIINDILDISKIESGQLKVNLEKCAIDELFIDLKTFFSEHNIRNNKEHILLNFILTNEINNHFILTDKVKLNQILINLIGNALKFTENGTIECGYKLLDHKIMFYVSDTGIGIPDDKQEHIFNRFYQLKNKSKLNLRGTGLGLSIVKGLVNILGGDIWLVSKENKGSTFYFTINYIKAEKELDYVKKKEINQVYNFDNKTVLIVEDDESNAFLINEILDNKGLKLINTKFGKNAIEIVSNRQIDLILMDIQLPDINGYDATLSIKQLYPDIKIVAQTAYASIEEKQKALNSGCVDYISKPINIEHLMNILTEQLS